MGESMHTVSSDAKIRRGSLKEQVQEHVRKMILANQLRPGEPIVIGRLAKRLDVSHTPVREALAMLEREGLVITRPYENPRVAEIEESDVKETYQMRLLLEGWAIRQTCGVLADEDLGIISVLLDRARREISDSRYDSHLEADLELHALILQSTGNELFSQLARLVHGQSTRIRSLVEAVRSIDDIAVIIDEHSAIVDALRSRDREQAYQQLVCHLEKARERTLRALRGMRTAER